MNYWEGAREIERENGRQNKTQHNTKAAETPTDTHRLSAQIWKSKSETTEMAAPAGVTGPIHLAPAKTQTQAV